MFKKPETALKSSTWNSLRRGRRNALILLSAWGTQLGATEVTPKRAKDFVLRIATMDLEPYGAIDSAGKGYGMLFDYCQELGRRTGIPFTNTVLPFQRMLVELQAGRVDIASSQPHKAALDAGEKLAFAFRVNVIIPTKKGSPIRSVEELGGRTLVLHQGASYPQLDNIPLSIVRVNSYEQALEMVTARPDVFGTVITEPAYKYYLHKLKMKAADFSEPLLLESREQWNFVRSGLPSDIKDILVKCTKQLEKENYIDKMIEKYSRS